MIDDDTDAPVGETEPSSELEAYAIQRIAQNLIFSWMEQT